MFLNYIKYIFPIILLSSCASEWEPPPGYSGGDFMDYGEIKQIKVIKGESVYTLSKKYGISMRSIIDANNLKAPYILYANQKIILRPPNAYTVKKGDSLYSIAKKYNMNVYQLAKQNSIIAPYTIFSGQKLMLSFLNNDLKKEFVKNNEILIKRKKNNDKYFTNLASKVDNTGRYEVKKNNKILKNLPTPKRKKQISNITSQGFIWPVKGEITSQFGPGVKGLHNDGINISIPTRTKVVASETGVVVYSGNELQGFGNLLLIKHSNGWMTAYGHNDQLLVSRGDNVNKGQIISYSGSSGNVRSPQLHFEIRMGTKAVDPLKYLKL